MYDFTLQKFNFTSYYVHDSETPVSREECFTPGELPTADNSFRQRWYYLLPENWFYNRGEKGGYAYRLPQNELGEKLGKLNQAELKREERHLIQRGQCPGKVWGCKEECAYCDKRTSYIVSLDKPYSEDDEVGGLRDSIPDNTVGIEAAFLSEELRAALCARLSYCELRLLEFWLDKTKKQVIADFFGLSLEGVRYREERLRNKLRTDEVLRDYFEVI